MDSTLVADAPIAGVAAPPSGFADIVICFAMVAKPKMILLRRVRIVTDPSFRLALFAQHSMLTPTSGNRSSSDSGNRARTRALVVLGTSLRRRRSCRSNIASSL